MLHPTVAKLAKSYGCHPEVAHCASHPVHLLLKVFDSCKATYLHVHLAMCQRQLIGNPQLRLHHYKQQD